MPCYSPLRACLVKGPKGKSLSFSSRARGAALSLPCGRCIGCRLEKARQWAVRIVHEASMHEDSCFLTLTYDPEHLPADGSISISVCQLFLKRLRSRIDPIRIRFFLCGEYGEKFERPHYHVIVFGFAFPDKVLVKDDGDSSLHRSDLLDEVWGLGGCRIGVVTFDSACYVANYATKKVTGKAAAVHYSGRKPEFLLMSRRPGIGRSWIDKFSTDVYPSDEIISKGFQARPPRYYDKVVLTEDFVYTEEIRLKREKAASRLELFVHRSGVRTMIAPSRNAHRLAVRLRVAEAKSQLKSRSLET